MLQQLNHHRNITGEQYDTLLLEVLKVETSGLNLAARLRKFDPQAASDMASMIIQAASDARDRLRKRVGEPEDP